jgi:hypothetical protein
MGTHTYPTLTTAQQQQLGSSNGEQGEATAPKTVGQTTMGGGVAQQPWRKPSTRRPPEALPAFVADPDDPKTLIDLAATNVAGFNLVDGTVAIATSPQMPFILYKGYNPDTWFYAPRWGRMGKNPDGEPAFRVTKKVRNNPDGSQTTVGGILSFLVELVVELPTGDQLDEWTNLITTLYNLQPSAGQFNFQPLRLTAG